MKESTKKIIEDFFAERAQTSYLKDDMYRATEYLVDLYGKGGKILVCGNGGSEADSQHISGELLKGFENPRPLDDGRRRALKERFGEQGEFIANGLQQGIKCIPLPALTSAATAFLNDCDGRLVYAQLVNALGDKGDALIALSTSGNSENVVYAAMAAAALGMRVIAFTGEKGGKLKGLADIVFNVPESRTYRVQELHLPIYHILCLAVENEIFGRQ